MINSRIPSVKKLHSFISRLLITILRGQNVFIYIKTARVKNERKQPRLVLEMTFVKKGHISTESRNSQYTMFYRKDTHKHKWALNSYIWFELSHNYTSVTKHDKMSITEINHKLINFPFKWMKKIRELSIFVKKVYKIRLGYIMLSIIMPR